MDTTVLIPSFLFGVVGMGFFMYGKKAGRMIPLAAGLGLMGLPYFIPNVIVMCIVCTLLMITPAIVKEG